MANTTVTFWSKDDYSGKYKTFTNVDRIKDFNDVQWTGKSHDDMKDDASSIQTGSDLY